MQKEVILVKRRSFVLTTLLIFMLFTVGSQAVEVRRVWGEPGLEFDGTTAQCSALCRGGKSDDAIEATITLYQGTTYLDSWSDSGKGFLEFSGEYEVQRGKAYALTLTYSINGVEQKPVTITRTCG